MPPFLTLFLSLAFAAPSPSEGAEAWDISAAHGSTHELTLDLREGTWMDLTVHGDRVVFSLLGDLWSMPLAGGEASTLTHGAAWDVEPAFSPDGKQIAYTSDAGGSEQIWVMNADGSEPRQLTDDADARFTDPAWDPSGPWLLGRRRTVDTRSIGVTELWLLHLEGGKGVALTSKDEHPHAGEAVFSADGRYIYFSSRNGRFEYEGNPVAGLWTLQRLDRRTGEIRVVVQGAGSASHPMLSPDGRSLVFLTRDRARTHLEVLDLQTEQRRVIWQDLGTDQLEGFALHDTYPGMGWTPDGKLALWMSGRLWTLSLDGRRSELPFHVNGTWTLTDVPRWPRALPDQVASRVIRWPVWAADGSVAFSAAGVLWVRRPDGQIDRISAGTGYAPSWSPDGSALAWTSWDDKDGGRLHITPTKGGKGEELPVTGQLVNPAWSADGAKLVVLRGAGGQVDSDLGDAPWFEIVLLERSGRKGGWTSRVVTTTPNRGSASRAPRPFLHEGRVWYLEDRPGEPRAPGKTALVSLKLDNTDKRDHLLFDGAEEIVPSPDFSRVAYQWKHKVYVTALPAWGKTVTVANGDLPSYKLSEKPGGWLGWTPDGAAVTWATGPVLKKKVLQGVGVLQNKEPEEKPEKKDDKEEAPKPEDPAIQTLELQLQLPRARPSGVVAYTHARVITMRGAEVVEDATVVVDGDRIVSVTAGGAVPAGASTVDCTGQTIIPGLIDVHAHLHYSSGDVFPEQEWRYLTALDFGVTTVHDPSASTDLVFTQAERVEAGFEKGPRVLSTGYILYGALDNQGAETPSLEAARDHVQRLKNVGAGSVKIYQQPQRRQRQWYATACRELEMLCVTEGGGDLWQNLTNVVDGIHSVEHALSISPLYADVIGLYGGSHTASSAGTAQTPTLLVAYGGLSGENYFYQHFNPLDHARLLRHYPRRQLDARTWRLPMMVQDSDWNFTSVAKDDAALQRAGVLVTLGAHGQLQGLGTHWELWALASPGAMSPHDALRAATLDGARYLGMDGLLGSIEAGKLADFLVLDANPLEDIHNSEKISVVVKNGERFP